MHAVVQSPFAEKRLEWVKKANNASSYLAHHRYSKSHQSMWFLLFNLVLFKQIK